MTGTSQLRQLILRAVSDAIDPRGTGAVVSGGVDSSSIIRAAQVQGYDLPTFTGYYAGEAYDERYWANLVKGSEHHEILITPEDFVENFDDMLESAKPPYQGPGTFGQYMVAKYISENTDLRVILSGEGGDELFGGYCRLLMVAGEPRPDGYADYRLPEGYPDTLEEALEYDWERLPDLLAVDDQMMAAWGLEAVAPFMDDRVTSFVLALPPQYRVAKRYLKAAVVDLIPREIRSRTDKRGFPSPLVSWAQEDPVRGFVEERIGYVPAADKPWDRGWWLDLCQSPPDDEGRIGEHLAEARAVEQHQEEKHAA